MSVTVLRANVQTPAHPDNAYSHLSKEEMRQLLQQVEEGNGLSDKQRVFHNKTKSRDFAIMMILFGTGILISECVNLDLGDINLEENSFRVNRRHYDKFKSRNFYFNRQIDSVE